VSLIVEQLTAGYGTTDVLRDVDLVVPAGRVVALLGPNGAGKTTLLRSCSGALPAKRGRVLIDGVDATHDRPHVLVGRGLCVIPEGRAVFPSLTVAENLQLLGAADTNPAGARDQAVEAFPALGRKLGQLAGTLSGGEQQMLALARAYLTDPRYVLLDEVSMGLAPIIVDEIFEFLAQLTRRGAALLIVEQYVAKALGLADLVYVMHKGRITFSGEPTELDADALAESYLGGTGDAAASAAKSQA
jgi:branched-chain amino acid transport system ATP-binding protein